MLAGLASPSHLILVLALLLVLFGAKRVPELAKGLGTGIRELREGISTPNAGEAGPPEGEKARVETSSGPDDETGRAQAGRGRR